MKDFAGKVAVVTGAGSGIGRASAKAFARKGMKVALLDVREEALHKAVAEVTALGAEAIGVVTDVSSHDSVESAAATVEHKFGKIHVAMNNAGVFIRGVRVEDMDDAAWNLMINTNIYGLIHGIQAFVPRMRAHGEGGHVVNTASIAGHHVGDRESGAYNACKFAIVATSEALGIELRGSGIGVSILCPSVVASDFYVTSAAFRGDLAGPNRFATTPADIAAGMPPDEVAARMIYGIEQEQVFIWTHAGSTRGMIEERHARLMKDFDISDKYDAVHGGRR